MTNGKQREEAFSEVEGQLHNEKLFFESFSNSVSNPMKTLLQIYHGNYGRIVKSFLLRIMQYLPVLLYPIITAYVIDVVADRGGMTKIYIAIGILLFLILQNILANYLSTKYYSQAVRGVEAGLRSSMVRKLQQLSIPYHKAIQSGRIQSKVMRDVEAVEEMSTQLIINLFSFVINIVFCLVIVLVKSRLVLVFFLICIPPAILITVLFKQRIRSRNTQFRTEIEQTSASIMEMVNIIPVTKAHALEKVEIKKANNRLKHVADSGFRLDILQSLFGAVTWASFMFFQVICLCFTCFLAYKKYITIGEIAMYQSYFTTLVAQISSIMNLIPMMSKGLESIRSIGDIMNAHDVEENHGKPKLGDIAGAFSFQDVSFQYSDGKQEVLEHLNLEVKAGETIALVGESGCGKTTILNLVIGFYRPTAGTVALDGHDMQDIDLRSYREHIAVVPQNPIVFSGTIRENISYGMPEVSDDTIREAVRAANLESFVAEMPDGLDTVIGTEGVQMSGGQMQRISIARALIRDPQVIILDEATSALDSISEQQITQALNRLSENRTTFIVAHRLATIRNADHIAVIENGACAEYGTYDELMALNGKFRALSEQQE